MQLTNAGTESSITDNNAITHVSTSSGMATPASSVGIPRRGHSINSLDRYENSPSGKKNQLC